MGGKPIYSDMTGEELRAIRERLGLTQPEMSQLLGLRTRNAVSWWEHGRSPIQLTHARLALAINRDIELIDIWAPELYDRVVGHIRSSARKATG